MKKVPQNACTLILESAKIDTVSQRKVIEMYQSKFANRELDLLFDAVLSLKNKEECYRFFEDLCTVNELTSLSQRLEVARLLYEKKTYAEIGALTTASTATISRINRSLEYGADGYPIVFERLKAREAAKDPEEERKEV